MVGAPVMFGRMYLVPIVLDFLKAYPEIDIELRLGDAPANMIEEQIDVAVRIGQLSDSSLIAVRAGEGRGAMTDPVDPELPSTPPDLSLQEVV